MSGLRRQLLDRSALSGAEFLARLENLGAFAVDFTDRSVWVNDRSTNGNIVRHQRRDQDKLASFFTYTSPSPKMVRHEDGLIQYAAHNLCLQSETFDSGTWSKPAASVSVSANAAIAPNGTLTADKITEDTANRSHETYQAINNVTTNQIYEISVRVKAAERTFVAVKIADASTNRYTVVVNLSTGAVSDTTTTGSPTNTSHTVTDEGNGWYRISVRQTQISGTIAYIGIDLSDSGTPTYDAFGSPTYTGDGSSGIYVWGARVSAYPCDTAYLPTTTAARYSIPIDHDASGKALGFLCEPQATNLVLRSTDLTNASWTKSNITTAQTATGPGGVANAATTLTANAGNATVTQAITSASSARTTSVYLKRRTGTGNIDLTDDNGSTWTTKTITSSWARYDITNTLANPTVGIRIVTSGDEIDVALFQHETGSVATSPIQTYASTVTRASDLVTVASSKVPMSTEAQSLVVKVRPKTTSPSGALTIFSIDSGGAANENNMYQGAGGNQLAWYVASTTAQVSLTSLGTISRTNDNLIASAISVNDAQIVKDAALAGSDTSCNMPATITTIRLGHSYTGAVADSVSYKFIAFVPRRLSNAELIQLTKVSPNGKL